MAWGSTKVTKEDLKEMGLDTDKLGKLDADQLVSKADLVEINQKLSTFDSIKATLDTLAEKMTPTAKPPVKTEEVEDTFDMDFTNDPRAAIRKVVAEQTAGVTSLALQTAASNSYERAKNSNPDIFRLFGKEIQEEWDKIGIQHKGTPDILIKNLVDMVKGRHLEEVATDARSGGTKFQIEVGGNSGNGGSEKPAAKPEDKLTADELDIAKKFNMTPEKYLERKNARAEGRVQYA